MEVCKISFVDISYVSDEKKPVTGPVGGGPGGGGPGGGGPGGGGPGGGGPGGGGPGGGGPVGELRYLHGPVLQLEEGGQYRNTIAVCPNFGQRALIQNINFCR